jgi:hypothetical protein
MDADARNRISPAERAALVTAALSSDMLMNYPLWITAKRVSAGLSVPPLRELYKGSGSLMFAMGPMLVVQDGSTAVMLRALEGRLDPTAAYAASACFSGAVGALTVGAQIEAVIVRAHATKRTIGQTVAGTYSQRGALGLVAPHGALMIAAREVPYAGCLFFLSGWIRGRLDDLWPLPAASPGTTSAPGQWSSRSVLRDVVSAVLTAAVAGPISQAPNVIAAHQQAHAMSLGAACREIASRGGVSGFFSGLLPRTVSLSGSLFIFPFTMEVLQPYVERWRAA